MNLVQITPGAGGMYCGNCFRDNALVAAMRKRGHEVLMVPLYLPMTLDEESQAAGVPTFFGGINVYLQQQSAFFRRAPKWLHSLLDSPALLKLAAGRAAKTRAADVGELSLSMLRGEAGNQARELDELIAWLKTQPRTDVVMLSNAMLMGFTRKLKAELGCKVVCNLQGEDAYLDSMPSPLREQVWTLLAERCRDCDLFIAPSRYFGDTMAKRLGLPAEKVKVVFNGISLEGYGSNQCSVISNHSEGARATSASPLNTEHCSLNTSVPTLGYFARMCREKGLDLLVEHLHLALPVVAAAKPRKGRRKGRIVPATRKPRAVMYQAQRAQGFDQREFTPVEFAHLLVAIDQRAQLLRALRPPARRCKPRLLCLRRR